MKLNFDDPVVACYSAKILYELQRSTLITTQKERHVNLHNLTIARSTSTSKALFSWYVRFRCFGGRQISVTVQLKHFLLPALLAI